MRSGLVVRLSFGIRVKIRFLGRNFVLGLELRLVSETGVGIGFRIGFKGRIKFCDGG